MGAWLCCSSMSSFPTLFLVGWIIWGVLWILCLCLLWCGSTNQIWPRADEFKFWGKQFCDFKREISTALFYVDVFRSACKVLVWDNIISLSPWVEYPKFSIALILFILFKVPLFCFGLLELWIWWSPCTIDSPSYKVHLISSLDNIAGYMYCENCNLKDQFHVIGNPCFSIWWTYDALPKRFEHMMPAQKKIFWNWRFSFDYEFLNFNYSLAEECVLVK